ncbi:MAG: hypothetical protein QM286_06060 [Acidobacteriota bacterium]|nr:hypothetical protein [Acidobacteriota bacterium]
MTPQAGQPITVGGDSTTTNPSGSPIHPDQTQTVQADQQVEVVAVSPGDS